MITFEAVVEPGRQGGAFVTLPPEVLEELDRGTRFRARGTFGGTAYRSSTMPTGSGRACLGVHKATREAAGVDVGDPVTVEIEVDDDPRELVMPPELDEALSESTTLRAAFDRLAPSRRRELAAGVCDAKRPETRRRRVEKILGDLHRT